MRIRPASIVTALRIAAAAPAELPARWAFAVAPSPLMAGRDALRRIMLALGVAPIVVMSAAFWMVQFGPTLALGHAAVTMVAGLILIEIQSWGVASIPCTRPLDPGAVNLQARWPAYVLGLVLFCGEVPRAQVALSRVRFGMAIMLLVMTVVWLLLRRWSTAAARLAAVSDDRDSLLLLDLSMPPPLKDLGSLFESSKRSPRS